MSEEETNQQQPKEIAPGLPHTETTQIQVNDIFMESGIAQRMLSSLHANQAANELYLTNDINRCNFGVYKAPGYPDPNEKRTALVIEYPNPDPETREKQPMVSLQFDFNKGGSFGLVEERSPRPGFPDAVSGPPLNEKQIAAVEKALSLQEQEKTTE